MLTFSSLFSGIGAPDLAAERLGLRHLWMCEIAPFPRKVLARRFPGVPVYDDIRRLHARGECVQLAERWRRATGLQARADGRAALVADAGCADCCERPDILWASPPCQDLSIAGKRAGIAGARSGLFWDFHRLARELQPTWILMEQVPGLFSSNGGRDFNEVISALDELGYGLAWRVLDSRYLGVPQRRRRVYLVGRLGEPCPSEVLFESEGSQRDLATGGEEGPGSADEITGGVAGTLGGRNRGDELDRHGAYIPEVGYALRADPGGTGQGHNVTYVPVVGATLKANTGRNHIEQDYIPEVAYAVKGSSARHVSQREDDTTTIAHTLRASGFDASEDGTGRATPMVAAPLTAGTAPSGMAGRRKEDDVNLVAVTSGPKMFDASGYHRESVSEDVTPTIAAYEQPMMISPSVRRLTPRECERLQGFPDDWTCLCEGECKCADGPRYAALGNAVTVNAAEWVIGRTVIEAMGKAA